MSNSPLDRTVDLLAHPYHFIDRRCRYYATDIYERKVLFERASALGKGESNQCFGYEPSVLPGIRPNQMNTARSENKSSQIAALPYRAVKAKLFSMSVPASLAYFAYRMKRQWGKFA